MSRLDYNDIVYNILNIRIRHDVVNNGEDVLFISHGDNMEQAKNSLLSKCKLSDINKAYAIVVSGNNEYNIDVGYYRISNRKIKECSKRKILKRFYEYKDLDTSIITSKKYPNKLELHNTFLSILLTFIDDKNALQYELPVHGIDDEMFMMSKLLYDVYKQNPKDISALYTHLKYKTPDFKFDYISRIVQDEFYNYANDIRNDLVIYVPYMFYNTNLLLPILNTKRNKFIRGYEIDDEDITLDNLILFMNDIKGKIELYSNIEYAKEKADICVCRPYSTHINQTECVIESMKHSNVGIFVIDKAELINLKNRNKLMKSVFVKKIIDVGSVNTLKETLIIVCEQKPIEESVTKYYDLRELNSFTNAERKDELVLNYLIGLVPPKEFSLSDNNDVITLDINVKDIIEYVHDKSINHIPLKGLLSEENLKSVSENIYSNLYKFTYTKYKLSDLLYPMKEIITYTPKNSKLGDIPLYDYSFNVIGYISTKYPSINDDTLVCFNEFGECFRSSTPYCIDKKITVYKCYRKLTDIDLLMIGYQLRQYQLNGYSHDNIEVYITS